ncbi:MAG: glycosyltransferase family 1 protein [Proteobacteria bacterium]|nr:glycosyltransferase family 1 protein [Pseudomonadota bacterium]
MKLLIATDAWSPQVNGVVNTYKNILPILQASGLQIDILNPYSDGFKRSVLSLYPEIEYVTNLSQVKKILQQKIDTSTFIHIATEGPIGLATRNYCAKNKIPFTTGFHTLFPEFIAKRFWIPSWITYKYFRWFHSRSETIFVPTSAIKRYLKKKGFNNLRVWTRGVDTQLFTTLRSTHRFPKKPGYILCVSRASKEKGIDDFCKLNHPNKVFIGEGPYLESLKKKYPDVTFLGKKVGEELADWYANADCFVFPSKTDTFGIVLLESIASGTPVAAYPEPGPLEVILNGRNGAMDNDLSKALEKALLCDRYETYLTSGNWTWANAAKQFMERIEEANK